MFSIRNEAVSAAGGGQVGRLSLARWLLANNQGQLPARVLSHSIIISLRADYQHVPHVLLPSIHRSRS